MDIVSELDVTHAQYWADQEPLLKVFSCPDDMPDCVPAQAFVTTSGDEVVVRTAWRPSLADVEALKDGGVIWLSTWGGLPPHMLEVQAP